MRTFLNSLWLPLLIGTTMASTAIAQNTFPPSGSVGIGTSNPQTTLHLKASGGHSCAAQLRLDLQIGGATNGCGPANSLWDISSRGSNTLAFTTPLSGTPVLTLTGLGRIGINTGTPKAKLDISGNVRIFDGTQGANKVLTSDMNGLASWQLPAAGIGGAGPPHSLTKFTSATTVGGSQISDDGVNIVVSSFSFAGSGTKMVVANQNGKLSTQIIAPPPAGDNLGNHKATVNLDMQARDILTVAGIRFDGQPAFLRQTSASPWIYHNLPSGHSANSNFLIGQGNIDPFYKLVVQGNAQASGGVWTDSDAALKHNLAPIQDPIRKLQRVRGVTYDLRPDPATPPYRGVGLVAQEVRVVLPEAVRENSDGQLALNYNGAIALLIEAVKEQQATIKIQQARIDVLECRLERLERSPDN